MSKYPLESLPALQLSSAAATVLCQRAIGVLQPFGTLAKESDGTTTFMPSADAPEVIVLLLRSAELRFAAIEGVAQAFDITLPPVIKAHIGRELLGAYYSQKKYVNPHPFQWFWDDSEKEDYRDWLQTYPYAEEVVIQMIEEAERLHILPERVLIFDDCIFEGGTAFAAHHMVKWAFDLVEEPTLHTLYVTNFESYIIDAIFPKEPPYDEGMSKRRKKHLKREWRSVSSYFNRLLKGYLETSTSLQPIESRAQLEPLDPTGYQLASQFYTDEVMLTFRAQVMAALREAVRIAALSEASDITHPLVKRKT